MKKIKKIRSSVWNIYNLVFWHVMAVFMWWLMLHLTDTVTHERYILDMLLFVFFSLPKQIQMGMWGDTLKAKVDKWSVD